MTLAVGDPAPDFTLPNQAGQPVTLSSLRGLSNVVLVFYPYAFSRICTGELCDIRDRAEPLTRNDAVILGVSVDTKYALRAFKAQEGLPFDLLSDFWPHGEVARRYGVFLDGPGNATRATFVIDKAGTIRWLVINHPGQARDPGDYQSALELL